MCHVPFTPIDKRILCSECQSCSIHVECFVNSFNSNNSNSTNNNYVCSICRNPYIQLYVLYRRITADKTDLICYKYSNNPIKLLINILSGYESNPAIFIDPRDNEEFINQYKYGERQVYTIFSIYFLFFSI